MTSNKSNSKGLQIHSDGWNETHPEPGCDKEKSDFYLGWAPFFLLASIPLFIGGAFFPPILCIAIICVLTGAVFVFIGEAHYTYFE